MAGPTTPKLDREQRWQTEAREEIQTDKGDEGRDDLLVAIFSRYVSPLCPMSILPVASTSGRPGHSELSLTQANDLLR